MKKIMSRLKFEVSSLMGQFNLSFREYFRHCNNGNFIIFTSNHRFNVFIRSMKENFERLRSTLDRLTDVCKVLYCVDDV